MYTEKGSLLDFFMPIIPVATTDSGVLQEIDIGASSADHGELSCFRRCSVRRLAFAVTGEAASGTTTAPTVIFTKRPTPNSATGESVICTLTIPSGTAIGKTVYKDIDPVNFAVGDSLEISHTVGVGTPTGMGVAYGEADEDPERAANESDMIASA